MARNIKVKDATLARYSELREKLRTRMGTSKVTRNLVAMNEEELHGFANELLELFDILDGTLGS